MYSILAGKWPNIQSYTVHIYGSGQPYKYTIIQPTLHFSTHKASGLCGVQCTVRYACYCTHRNFENYGVVTILEDVIYRNYSNILYGVRYGGKLALPVKKWPQEGLSTPKPPIFAPQCGPLMCWRHTMLPWTTRGCVKAASARGKGPAAACMESQSQTHYLIPGWYFVFYS
jgi:hypothetical protein